MFADGLQVASEEAAFYVLLKPLQGGAIPALFGISSLKVPGAGLLVLELIEGMPLSDLDEVKAVTAEGWTNSGVDLKQTLPRFPLIAQLSILAQEMDMLRSKLKSKAKVA